VESQPDRRFPRHANVTPLLHFHGLLVFSRKQIGKTAGLIVVHYQNRVVASRERDGLGLGVALTGAAYPGRNALFVSLFVMSQCPVNFEKPGRLLNKAHILILKVF
jgi:hypothetical protein